MSDFAKEHQERLKVEADEKDALETITKRVWILRKLMPNGDERRFCEPCMKWFRAVGHSLGNLAKSPWVNGGVSVAEMKEKARRNNTKASRLWSEAYRDHEGKGHKKAVELEKTHKDVVQVFP